MVKLGLLGIVTSLGLFILFLIWRKSRRISILVGIVGSIMFTGVYIKRRTLYVVAKKTYRALKAGKLPRFRAPRKQSTCAVTLYSLKLSHDNYSLHRQAGVNRSDIELVSSEQGRNLLIKKGVLMPLSSQKGYSVQHMNYGSPYLHHEMLSIVNEIDERFEQKMKAKGLKDVSFVISSAYRTTSDQERLRKVNKSATPGTSSHSYGVSVDIPRLKGKSCREALPLFGEVLREMQREKKIYLCPESKTLHITVQ